MFVYFAIISVLLALLCGCLAGYLGTKIYRRKRLTQSPIIKSSRRINYNRITELEQETYGHMWPNPDSPWNQAAITQMEAMRRQAIENDVRRRQREAYKKQESAVVQTLKIILGRERNGR